MSTLDSPQSRTTSLSEHLEPDRCGFVGDIVKGTVGGKVLDLDPEIEVPQVVGLRGPSRWSAPPGRRGAFGRRCRREGLDEPRLGHARSR